MQSNSVGKTDFDTVKTLAQESEKQIDELKANVESICKGQQAVVEKESKQEPVVQIETPPATPKAKEVVSDKKVQELDERIRKV